MENEFVVEVVSQAVKVTLMLAAPMLIGALISGCSRLHFSGSHSD